MFRLSQLLIQYPFTDSSTASPSHLCSLCKPVNHTLNNAHHVVHLCSFSFCILFTSPARSRRVANVNIDRLEHVLSFLTFPFVVTIGVSLIALRLAAERVWPGCVLNAPSTLLHLDLLGVSVGICWSTNVVKLLDQSPFSIRPVSVGGLRSDLSARVEL